MSDMEKKIEEAAKKSWKENKDEEYDFEMDGVYFKSGFREGAEWMRQEMENHANDLQKLLTHYQGENIELKKANKEKGR